MNELSRFKLKPDLSIILVVVCSALLLWKGMTSFISSSEFWSIYLSKHIFHFRAGYDSVFLKPAFHFILGVLHFAPFDDVQHIYVAKILFVLNGTMQFILVYKILDLLFKSRWSSCLLTIFLFSSPMIFTHFDRIRSDQLALSLFLFYFYLYLKNPRLSVSHHCLFLLLFPAIAFKHAYFTLLGLALFPFAQALDHFQKSSNFRKLIFTLLWANLLIWPAYFSIPALNYLIQSYESSAGPITLLRWLKTEWFYIYASTIPLFIPGYRSYLRTLQINWIFKVQIIILAIFILHPQRYSFFLASFLPIFYLNGVIFVNYLRLNQYVLAKVLLPIIALMSCHNIYLAQKHFKILSTNRPQFQAIAALSKIVTKNELTYLDGMGVLPRGKNVGCFFSPDDFISNQACVEMIYKRTPDVIIATNRLLGLSQEMGVIENLGYQAKGPNLYIRKETSENIILQQASFPPPSLIFSYEQLY